MSIWVYFSIGLALGILIGMWAAFTIRDAASDARSAS